MPNTEPMIIPSLKTRDHKAIDCSILRCLNQIFYSSLLRSPKAYLGLQYIPCKSANPWNVSGASCQYDTVFKEFCDSGLFKSHA